MVRPFSTIRRQKLLAKAKQVVAAAQAARQSPLSPLSPTARTPASTMGKTIAKIDLQTASAQATTTIVKPTADDAEKSIDKDDKGNSSDSEYSSLEDNDNDDNQGKFS